jgi:hypothetical protein
VRVTHDEQRRDKRHHEGDGKTQHGATRWPEAGPSTSEAKFSVSF